MKHERATEETREIAAFYALGALTYHKGRSFELHLNEGCPACEEELRRFRLAAADLGLSTQEILPPEYIRDLLATRIEREPQKEIETIAEAAPEQEQSSPISPTPILSSLNKPEKKRSGGFAWLSAVAVVLLALIAGVFLHEWRVEKALSNRMRARIEAIDSEQSKTKSVLGAFEQKAANLEIIESVIVKSGTKLAHIAELGPGEAYRGVVFFNPMESQCILMGNLPAPPAGKVYQAWYALSLTNKISAGIIKVDSLGAIFEKFDPPKEAANAAVIVISLEPAGGSQQPTLPLYAVARLN